MVGAAKRTIDLHSRNYFSLAFQFNRRTCEKELASLFLSAWKNHRQRHFIGNRFDSRMQCVLDGNCSEKSKRTETESSRSRTPSPLSLSLSLFVQERPSIAKCNAAG